MPLKYMRCSRFMVIYEFILLKDSCIQRQYTNSMDFNCLFDKFLLYTTSNLLLTTLGKK